jgi:hypothetical protein
MAKMAAAESENSNGNGALDVQSLKTPSTKRAAVSPSAAKSAAAAASSKKGLVIYNFNTKFLYIF